MKLERINELARKQKTVGLTEEEKAEQAQLRKEYIAAVRANVRSQLNNIDMKEADGSIVNLGEKYGDVEDGNDKVSNDEGSNGGGAAEQTGK